jgi:hypothetical protein
MNIELCLVAKASIIPPSTQIPTSMFAIAPEDHHETQDMSRLDIQKIEDGQQPALRNNGYFLSRARANDPVDPTRSWEPADPSPFAVYITAMDPAIFFQLEGNTALMLVYLNICCTMKGSISDEDFTLMQCTDFEIAASPPERTEGHCADGTP